MRSRRTRLSDQDERGRFDVGRDVTIQYGTCINMDPICRAEESTLMKRSSMMFASQITAATFVGHKYERTRVAAWTQAYLFAHELVL